MPYKIKDIQEKLPPHLRLVEASYMNTRIPAKFVDIKFGEFEAIPRKVLKGMEHPERRKSLKHQAYAISIEVACQRAKELGLELDAATYKDASTKARFLDPEYGEWWAMPKQVFSKNYSHPKRGAQKNADLHKNTAEDVVAMLPSHITLDISTFKGMRQQARFVVGSKEIWCYPNNFLFKLKKRGVIGYKPNGNKGGKKLTFEKIKSRLPWYITINYSTFVNCNTKAEFIDSRYGSWWTTPNLVFAGCEHPNVPRKNGSLPLPIEEVKSRLPEYITIKEETYIRAGQKATFIDRDYGEFRSLVQNVLRGHRHPAHIRASCANTIEEVKEKLPKNILLKEETYTNMSTKAAFTDKEYGDFEATPTSVISYGYRHPRRPTDIEQAIIDRFKVEKFDKNLSKHTNYRPKDDKDVDYKPDFKFSDSLYINTDGLVYHSDAYEKNRYYHFAMRETYEILGLRILQFRSDEIHRKFPIVASIINNCLGKTENKVGARKCELKEVPNKEAQIFLGANHLMGKYASAKYLGLYYNNELVETFGYRNKEDGGIEIARLCTKVGWQVMGGFSRLLKETVRVTGTKKVLSYVDLRYGNGGSLLKLGFKATKTTLGWKWTDCDQTFNRLQCRANMDERKLPEKEHAKELGWYRIYDAGQRLFVLDL